MLPSQAASALLLILTILAFTSSTSAEESNVDLRQSILTHLSSPSTASFEVCAQKVLKHESNIPEDGSCNYNWRDCMLMGCPSDPPALRVSCSDTSPRVLTCEELRFNDVEDDESERSTASPTVEQMVIQSYFTPSPTGNLHPTNGQLQLQALQGNNDLNAANERLSRCATIRPPGLTAPCSNFETWDACMNSGCAFSSNYRIVSVCDDPTPGTYGALFKF